MNKLIEAELLALRDRLVKRLAAVIGEINDCPTKALINAAADFDLWLGKYKGEARHSTLALRELGAINAVQEREMAAFKRRDDMKLIDDRIELEGAISQLKSVFWQLGIKEPK